MEITPCQRYPLSLIYSSRFSALYSIHYLRCLSTLSPQNHVQWTETPESHIFSADIPGVRKEEVKVEVEDGIYMIIRTEALEVDPESESRSFMRKFRLPSRVDVEGISAGYEDGVLTVTVPRWGFVFIDPSDRSNSTSELTAPAA